MFRELLLVSSGPDSQGSGGARGTPAPVDPGRVPTCAPVVTNTKSAMGPASTYEENTHMLRRLPERRADCPCKSPMRRGQRPATHDPGPCHARSNELNCLPRTSVRHCDTDAVIKWCVTTCARGSHQVVLVRRRSQHNLPPGSFAANSLICSPACAYASQRACVARATPSNVATVCTHALRPLAN